MSEKKYTYRVKAGRKWGPYHEYGPGMTIELTEDEAGGFLDTLELVKNGNVIVETNEAAHLATLTVGQLRELPEYAEMENPKPKSKADILHAILEARGLLEEDAE